MTRSEEISYLLGLSPEAVIEKAGRQIRVLETVDHLYRHFADSIADEIVENNRKNQATKLILPVGPVGQYPILAKRVQEENIRLDKCWFFMMDEYCDEGGEVLPADHPLSFHRVFNEAFIHRLEARNQIPEDQVIFPNRNNLPTLTTKIAELGGIDTVYGGIGIHGHVAFNEPEPGVGETDPRVVKLNDFTRTINAVRSQVGGNLENYPRFGITLGMRQLFGARRIRLYCRNGLDMDWANTVLRLAVLGQPGDDYPVTQLRGHADYQVVTDEVTLMEPKIVL